MIDRFLRIITNLCDLKFIKQWILKKSIEDEISQTILKFPDEFFFFFLSNKFIKVYLNYYIFFFFLSHVAPKIIMKKKKIKQMAIVYLRDQWTCCFFFLLDTDIKFYIKNMKISVMFTDKLIQLLLNSNDNKKKEFFFQIDRPISHLESGRNKPDK